MDINCWLCWKQYCYLYHIQIQWHTKKSTIQCIPVNVGHSWPYNQYICNNNYIPSIYQLQYIPTIIPSISLHLGCCSSHRSASVYFIHKCFQASFWNFWAMIVQNRCRLFSYISFVWYICISVSCNSNWKKEGSYETIIYTRPTTFD